MSPPPLRAEFRPAGRCSVNLKWYRPAWHVNIVRSLPSKSGRIRSMPLERLALQAQRGRSRLVLPLLDIFGRSGRICERCGIQDMLGPASGCRRRRRRPPRPATLAYSSMLTRRRQRSRGPCRLPSAQSSIQMCVKGAERQVSGSGRLKWTATACIGHKVRSSIFKC